MYIGLSDSQAFVFLDFCIMQIKVKILFSYSPDEIELHFKRSLSQAAQRKVALEESNKVSYDYLVFPHR